MESREMNASADVKRLMLEAVCMQRSSQYDIPKYARIVELLREYHSSLDAEPLKALEAEGCAMKTEIASQSASTQAIACDRKQNLFPHSLTLDVICFPLYARHYRQFLHTNVTNGAAAVVKKPQLPLTESLRLLRVQRDRDRLLSKKKTLYNSEMERYFDRAFASLDPSTEGPLRRQLIARKMIQRAKQLSQPSKETSIYHPQFVKRHRRHRKTPSFSLSCGTEDDPAKHKAAYRNEKKRQYTEYQQYLLAIMNHAREFYTFHKQIKHQIAKCARNAKLYVEQRISKAEREEDRQGKLRLKALKSNDMKAYIKLVAEAKNERLSYLLSQTNRYLDSIRKLIREHKEKHCLAKAPAPLSDGIAPEDDDLDYLEIASKGELPTQPMMLVGGDLKEYQLRGLQWMISLYENHLNGILADEMGLGKTIQTIALLTHITEMKHNHGPFLVVVPLSTLSNWVNEFKKWAPKLLIVVYKGAPQVRKDLYRQEMASVQFNVLLTTYEYTMKDKHVLRKYEWQYIIVDEGHRMKNAQSKFAMTLGTMYKSRNRLLLTGTPLQNSLPELWSLLNFLLPTIFESVDTFEQWFSKPFAQFSGGTTDTQNDLSNEERMLIINRLHQVLRPFLLRRVKASVLDQLPEKVERVLKCELSGWQKILYRRIQEGGAILLQSHAQDNAKNLAVPGEKPVKYSFKGLSNVLMQLRKVCNHPYLFQAHEYPIDLDLIRSSGKFELLDRMLPKLKAAGHRVLMFSQMTQLMHILEDYFRYRNFSYLRLDGSTSADEREQRMFMFNASDSPFFIFLLSTRAGGLGLNLATADTVIIFDSDWNPAMDAQAQDRAHRIGQKNEVRVFRLVTNNSVEEKILSRAADKMNMNNLVVEAGKFNNRSKEAERRAMLESLINMETEDSANLANDRSNAGDENLSLVLEDEELNEMMALTEEEFGLYHRMDKERMERDKKEWRDYCENRRIPHKKEHFSCRLMPEEDVPEWLQDAKLEKESKSGSDSGAYTLSNQVISTSFVRRKRKEVVSYRESLTDSQFIRICESGAEPNSVGMKKRKLTVSKSTKAAANVRPSCFALPQALHEEADRRARKLRKILCYFYRKIHDGVLKLTDAQGHLRSALFLEKPSAVTYPDYYQIIQHPIDLATIKKRVDDHLYSSHEMFYDDFRLMVENAQAYNPPHSLVVQDALEIQRHVQLHMEQLQAKTLSQLKQEYELAKEQHRQRSKARKEKKRLKQTQ